MIPKVILFERGRDFESPDAIGALSLTPLSSQKELGLAINKAGEQLS